MNHVGKKAVRNIGVVTRYSKASRNDKVAGGSVRAVEHGDRRRYTLCNLKLTPTRLNEATFGRNQSRLHRSA